MPSRADRDVLALREALAATLPDGDPRRADLTASTVRVLLAARSGRPEDGPEDWLEDWPAPVRAAAAAVGTADLGEVYQRLLGSSRTPGGVYYTPSWLVEHLLDVTLGPVLEEAARHGVEGVLALRVCDPSCGSGRFLVAAARRIGERLAALGHPDPLAAAVAQCVLGVDLDPVAAELALAALRDLGGTTARVWVGDGMGAAGAELAGRCDVVVGNPPFRSRMRGSGAGRPAYGVDGVALGPYTDLAAAFLVRGTTLLAPGGRLAMVQPRSVLSARDAGPVRRAVGDRAELVGLWSSSRAVFPATPVLTCAPVLHRPHGARPGGPRVVSVVEDRGAPRDVPVAVGRLGEGWAFLLAEHPDAAPARAGRRTLGDEAECRGDFRDQYYGLVGHVVEGTPGPGAPALLTTGSIDPARCAWGERRTRFARREWLRPVVAVAGLEGGMARWAAARTVPKVLVATQGRVLEAVVDEHGAWLPSVPVLSVLAPPGRLWHLLAALLSPVLTAHAAAEYAGSALAAGAIKLSAAQLAALPLPAEGADWDAAADGVRRAQHAASADERAEHLLAAAVRSTAAYAADDDLVPWWAARAERSVPGIGEALRRRG